VNEVPQAVERYWDALVRRDLPGAAACLHDGFVEDGLNPESGSASIVEYFAAPFEAADWRADLVERIP
jgi:hypothetical protein